MSQKELPRRIDSAMQEVMQSHPELEQLLTDIARKFLRIDSLASSPATPFHTHTVPVDDLREALLAAYLAGATENAAALPADLHRFDDYEIHAMLEYRAEDGSRYVEPAPDNEAHYWSLFGHVPGQGLECIGDFPSRALAIEIYTRITGQPYVG